VTRASGAYRFVNNTAISAGTGCTQVNATTVSCSATGIDQIVANANDGNDVMNLNGAGAIRATLNGGTGNDTLTGTSLANRFVGEAGADVFNSLGSVDIVSYAERTASQPVVVTLDGVANDGRSGEADYVKTDVEDVVGGAGADTLKAIAGNAVVNVLNGGAGNDKIRTREGEASKGETSRIPRLVSRESRLRSNSSQSCCMPIIRLPSGVEGSPAPVA
jgi:Ca2+-binding RTX toxin-like protein